MKIVLAFPCQKRYINDPSMSILPIGLLSLGAVLQEAGHQVQLIHLARYTVKDGIRLILSEEPDLIGLSCFSFQRQRTLELAEKLATEFAGKFAGKLAGKSGAESAGESGRGPASESGAEHAAVPIVLGGPHAAPLALEIMERYESVAGVVTGEGEKVFPHLVGKLEKGENVAGLPGLAWRNEDDIIIGEPVDFIEELDELPSLPAADLNIMGVGKALSEAPSLGLEGLCCSLHLLPCTRSLGQEGAPPFCRARAC